MKIHLVAGARPNFMKIAPLWWELSKTQHEVKIIHTGQHYDYSMSKIFFEELSLPEPHFFLGVASGSHAFVTADCMQKIEQVFVEDKPDLVIVVGDVNSTVAATLAAVKLGIKVAHVEAGLRSFDKSMPEEINRIVTDSISDLFFISEYTGLKNLLSEGKPVDKLHLVGNVMIDTLSRLLPKARKLEVSKSLGLQKDKFCLCTFHRPSNVDTEESLKNLLRKMSFLSAKLKIVLPLHPRTKANLQKFGLVDEFRKYALLVSPLGYLEFVSLMNDSRLVVTDSGGVQEETTVLGIPCLTLRENTERPITVTHGTNQLIGLGQEAFEYAINKTLQNKTKNIPQIDYWDGYTSTRIVEILSKNF